MFAAAFFDELTKVAAARWLREMRSGKLNERAMTRLGNRGFAAMGELSGGALARARINKQQDTLMKAEGNTLSSVASRPLMNSLSAAALRTRFSGAHAPRAGETTIPATLSGETVRDPATQRRPWLFRGNTFTPSARRLPTEQIMHATRHPDVAANYALGSAEKGVFSPVNRQVYLYRRQGFVETPADRGNSFWSNPATRSARSRRPTQMRATNGPVAGSDVSNYEATAPWRNQQPVGQYGVRPAMQNGNPVFALKRVFGPPAAQVFPNAT